MLQFLEMLQALRNVNVSQFIAVSQPKHAWRNFPIHHLDVFLEQQSLLVRQRTQNFVVKQNDVHDFVEDADRLPGLWIRLDQD